MLVLFFSFLFWIFKCNRTIIMIDSFNDSSSFEYGFMWNLTIQFITEDIILTPSLECAYSIRFFYKNTNGLSIVRSTKFFEFFFPESQEQAKSFHLNVFWYLILKLSCRNTVMAVMCGKRKCMKLGNPIIRNEFFRCLKIFIRFSWESNDEISSYIELDSVGTFYFF